MSAANVWRAVNRKKPSVPAVRSRAQQAGGWRETQRMDIHIDGGESTVGDRAANSAGEGEAGVETQPAELGRGGINLGSHCVWFRKLRRELKAEWSGDFVDTRRSRGVNWA